MGRLIDADALKELFSEVIGHIAKKPEMNGNLEHMVRASAMVIQMIDDAPTVNALNCSEIPNNWIPCSERLPEDEYVLISKKPSKISGDKWCVAIAIRTADQRSRKVQWRDTGFGVIPDDNVLAWMPFPEPYQGRGEEHETD